MSEKEEEVLDRLEIVTIIPVLEYIPGVVKIEDGTISIHIHDLDTFLSLEEEKTLGNRDNFDICWDLLKTFSVYGKRCIYKNHRQIAGISSCFVS